MALFGRADYQSVFTCVLVSPLEHNRGRHCRPGQNLANAEL